MCTEVILAMVLFYVFILFFANDETRALEKNEAASSGLIYY